MPEIGRRQTQTLRHKAKQAPQANRNRNKQIDKHMKQHHVGWLVCVCGFRPNHDACRRLATFVTLSAFVWLRVCAAVRCSLVTNWLGMRTDWFVGVKMMSVTVPSFMVFDVDVNVDDLNLRLCCIHMMNYNLCCVAILQFWSICWLVRLSRTARVLFVCVSLSLMSSALCSSVVQLSVCEHRMYHFSFKFSHFRFHFLPFFSSSHPFLSLLLSLSFFFFSLSLFFSLSSHSLFF